jgi:PAS domain S-box-containing protein
MRADGALEEVGLLQGRQDRTIQPDTALQTAYDRQPDSAFGTLDAAGVATWTVDLVSGLASGSPRLRFLFGLPEDSRVWTPTSEYLKRIHPDDRVGAEESVRRSAEWGQALDLEFRVTGTDGEERWVLSRGTTTRDAAGAPDRMSGAIIDITDRRRAETELRTAKRWMDAVLQSAEIVTWDYDPSTGIISGDANLAAMFGMEPHEGMRAPAEKYIARLHPEDQPKIAAAFGKAATEGAPYEEEYRIVIGDRVRWAVARGFAETDDGGRVVRLPGVMMDITSQRTAQERQLAAAAEIAHSEERYHSLFETINEGFCIIEVQFDAEGVGTDYHFLEVNPAFEKLTGISRKEARSGNSIRELYPDFESTWPRFYGNVAKTGIAADFTDYSSALGRWFEISATRVGGEGSGRVAVIFDDITARKGAEEERERLVAELTVERQKLRGLFDQAPAFIAVLTGRDMVFEHVNEAYYGVVGHREVLGKPVLEALPEVDGQGYMELLHGVMDTGEPMVGKGMPIMLQRDPNGPAEQRFLDLTYQAALDADGKIYGVLAHGVDVTDQVLAQRRIAQSEELFRTVYEQAPDDAIVVMDIDRTILAWNPAAERICRWTAEEAIGQRADFLFSEEDRAALAPEREAEVAARQGKTANELWHVRRDGSRFWGSGTMNSLHHADGTVRGFLKIFRDATERHETDRRIRELNDSLEAKVRERTEELEATVKEAEGFNYSIAHDLRAPLRAIGATAGILLEDAGPELSEEHRELLARQSENAVRLGRLIDELLRLSRLARVEVKRLPLDMTALVRTVVDEVGRDGRLGRCRFEVQEGMTATGDASLVQTVLHNLLGNACKFSPDGGTTRVGQTGKTFFVSDEGVGFDMKFAPKLFLPFERLVTEAEFPGTGIGLANVERIVRRHGGSVWAESELGKGASFYFTLEE